MTNVGEKNRVKVFIFGQEYTVIGDKPPEYIEKIAEDVDSLMVKIHQSNPHMPHTKIAVLAALNFADEVAKSKEEYKWLLEIIEDEKKKVE